jgi:ferritin-like metal-binding protein YciE
MKSTTATKSRSTANRLSSDSTAKGNTPRSATTSKPGLNSQRTATAESGNSAQTGTETPFEKLFRDILKDTYWAEQHIVESMPAMIEATTTESLREAFEDHLHVTQKQVKRLEKVFNLINQPAEAVKCPVMEALVKEATRCIEETPEGSMTRDAGLIISAQKIEHYEIAAYGSLVQVALTLGHGDAAELLEKTLMEEEDTDYQLSEIAETEVNPMADYDQEEGEGTEEADTEIEEE